ncbi:MAG: hypothetical protein ACTSVI_08515 [Promethearchaeota archaeon]
MENNKKKEMIPSINDALMEFIAENGLNNFSGEEFLKALKEKTGIELEINDDEDNDSECGEDAPKWEAW